MAGNVSALASARHDPGLSTAAVKIFPDHIEAEATFARADIEALVPLDVDHDGKVSAQEWQQARPILEPLLRETLIVRGNDDPTVMTEVGFQLDENDNFHVAGILRAEGAKLTVESPLIKRLPRGHRQFLSVLNNQGAPLGEALLSAEHDTLDVNTEVAEEPRPSEAGSHVRRVLLHGRGTHPDRV